MEYSDLNLTDLWKALDWSSEQLKIYRNKRIESIRQFVGKHYGRGGTSQIVPINLIKLAVSVYTRSLVARNPKASVHTWHTELKAVASNLGYALDHLFEEIRFEESLRRWVKDAMFCLGVMKVGLETVRKVEIEGFLHDYGQPFADDVSFEDWIMDMTVHKYVHCDFMGNRYRLPYDYVMESGEFENTEDVQAEAVNTDNKSAKNIGKARGIGEGEYRKYVNLWDLWLPKENVVLTISESREHKPLKKIEWTGPECGPYHLLQFEDVPDNLMPLAPVTAWLDTHGLANRLFRKIGDQADRQKTILTYMPGADKDAEAIVASEDGSTLKVKNIDKQKEVKFGGVDQGTLAAFLQTKNLSSYMMGNLDIISGLNQEADTLGQEQILGSNANQQLTDMRLAVKKATVSVMRSLAFYLFYDPLIKIPITKRVPDTDVEVTIPFTADDIEGDFLDYNFDIQPYSMEYRSPEQQLNAIRQIFGEFVQPLMPFFQQQQTQIDIPRTFEVLAEYTNTPVLKEMIRFVPTPEGQREPVETPKMPQKPYSKHVYERINRTTKTQQGQDAALMQNLMGNRLQPAEEADLYKG